VNSILVKASAVVFWVLALVGCEKAAVSAFQRPPAAVSVAAAVTRDVPVYLDGIGKVVAREMVSIQPQVSGRITAIHFTDGADLRKGDALFTIDPRPYQAQLDAAAGNLAQSEAARAFARIQLERGQQLIESLSNLYNNPDTDPVGNVIAFIGAKGGVGSSTVCHNTAWAMSEILKSNVVVADLDLAFGTTGLDFNQDPVQGIAEALQSPERLDEVLLDRLLTKCSEHLSIFAAPVVLDRDYEISADACDLVLEVVRQNVPYVAVDLPHALAVQEEALVRIPQ